jgi:hypothetical protein
MIKYLFIILTGLFFLSCNQNKTSNSNNDSDSLNNPGGSYGKIIDEENITSSDQLPSLIKDKETLQIKLKGKIEGSCEHSGCWMDVKISNSIIMHVIFKDGGFTIPLDASGKDVVFEGIATKEIVSIEQLKKEAKYNKKTNEDINAIIKPDTIYHFVAEGLILK